MLAFARARERYPALPRGLLLDYCQAAWKAAVAGGDGHDLVDRFERALVLVAWTHRRSPRLSFRELVDQVIPQVALRPFMAPADEHPRRESGPVEAPGAPVEPGAPRHRDVAPREPATAGRFEPVDLEGAAPPESAG